MYLLLPVLAPVAYLAALIVTIRLVGGRGRRRPAVVPGGHPGRLRRGRHAAAGPGLALRRLQPTGASPAPGRDRGRRRRPAVMAVAAAAIVVAVVGLCLWARLFAGYHHSTVPGIFLALVIAAATVTTVSVARGTRAALAEP